MSHLRRSVLLLSLLALGCQEGNQARPNDVGHAEGSVTEALFSDTGGLSSAGICPAGRMPNRTNCPAQRSAKTAALQRRMEEPLSLREASLLRQEWETVRGLRYDAPEVATARREKKAALDAWKDTAGREKEFAGLPEQADIEIQRHTQAIDQAQRSIEILQQRLAVRPGDAWLLDEIAILTEEIAFRRTRTETLRQQGDGWHQASEEAAAALPALAEAVNSRQQAIAALLTNLGVDSAQLQKIRADLASVRVQRKSLASVLTMMADSQISWPNSVLSPEEKTAVKNLRDTLQTSTTFKVQFGTLTGPRPTDSKVLKAFVSNQWQDVCPMSFGQKEAVVACRALGFPRTRKAVVRFSVNPPMRIGIAEVNCRGDETSLDECAHKVISATSYWDGSAWRAQGCWTPGSVAGVVIESCQE